MAKGFFSDRKRVMIVVFFFVLSYLAIYSLNYIDEWFTGLPGIGVLFPIYDWRFESPSVSPLYALMPALGFLSIYLLIHWTKRELEWDFMQSWLFLFVFIIFALIAFFFVLWFFWLPQYLNVTSSGGIFYTCSYYFEQDWSKVPGSDSAEKMGNAIESNPGNCLWKSCIQCGTLKFGAKGSIVQKSVCQLNYLRCFGNSAFFIFLLGGIAGWVSFRSQAFIEKSLL